MKIISIDSGFALYKEKDEIGRCALTPTPKGGTFGAFCILPQWRRKGYGSYLLKEALRALGGYDREQATVFTAPLPTDPGEAAFWAKFDFQPEGTQLVRRRTPDLTAVRFVQDFLAARLTAPRLCIDATCGNGGDTAFLCGLSAASGGRVLGFDIQPEAIASTRAHLAQKGFTAELHRDSHANLLQYVTPGTADAVMFNFGWLPGADHAVFSTAGSSIPRAGSGPHGPAPRRGAQCDPLQRAGHRLGRKAAHPAVGARPAPDEMYRIGVRFCQLGRYRPAALPAAEKIAKTLASMCIFC